MISHVSCVGLITETKDAEIYIFSSMQMKLKDRNYGAGFDKDGHFVPQHLRGPDVTLSRGKSVV